MQRGAGGKQNRKTRERGREKEREREQVQTGKQEWEATWESDLTFGENKTGGPRRNKVCERRGKKQTNLEVKYIINVGNGVISSHNSRPT